MSQRIEEDRAALSKTVMDMYLDDGNDHTIAEIAARLGWPESRVRSRMEDSRGFIVDGVGSHQASRQSYSRDYPGMDVGVHKVTLYGPTRAALRTALLAMPA